MDISHGSLIEPPCIETIYLRKVLAGQAEYEFGRSWSDPTGLVLTSLFKVAKPVITVTLIKESIHVQRLEL